MTIDFLPGDRVKIASDGPYNDEFKGKFATVVPLIYGPTPNTVTVSPDGDPTLKGMVQAKHVTYIPKRGDVVHVDLPDLSIWSGDHEVVSTDNDFQVRLQHRIGGGKTLFNITQVTLVRRADEPAPAPTPDPVHVDTYPVGCTVLDTKYSQIGEVVEHRSEHGATFPVVRFARADGSEYTVAFPNPEERLQRVHILTHEELSTVEKAHLLPSAVVANAKAAEILSKHLHPTRTQTFTVTFEMPAEYVPATEELVAQSLAASMADDVHITATEIKEKD